MAPLSQSIAVLLQEPDGRPVYQQIAAGIRGAIERRELGPGERVPAIRSLATELAVNRDTVALAYEALASEGLLESAVGRGTFVRAEQLSSPGEPASLELSAQVDRLLALGDARPRYGAGQDVVALHSLIPDPSLYPVQDFRRAFNRVVARDGANLFVYGSPQGHAGLRRVLARRFGESGMDVEASDIVLCHGASQGISLALRLFAGEGDCVAVEGPTYHNVLGTLAGLGVRPAVVPMTERGPDLAALERVLARPEVRAFYTIPSFHNPMGITTDAEHRRALVEIARRAGKPVIEDAFEMDLRCSGRPMPPLAALDPSGVVVHLFSFSKSLFPGARVGAITARGRALEGLVALKHATDLSDSLPLQAAMAEFVDAGDYDRHLGRVRRALRGRHAAVTEALEEHLPPGTRFTRADGGYQIWVELPFAVDTRDLLADAARVGVLFSPGSHFLPDGGPSRCLRLAIAQPGEDEIRSGVEALGRVIRARLEARPLAGDGAGVDL
jgi:DNA-binding transcriptional MocR family regulator